MYKFTFMTTVLLIALAIQGMQAQVRSGTFNVLLRTLLSHDVPEISVYEASKAAADFTYLDAREYKEYAVSHLRGAKYVGDKDFNLTNLSGIRKDKPLIVYCSIGKRSERIARKLRSLGYSRVYNLYGGIFEWVNQGHPVYNRYDQPTDSIHAYSRFWGRWLEKGIKVYE